MNSPRIKVLFLCTGNSARSQMAEALLRHFGADDFEAYSAGTEPKPIHPLTLRVLEEIGVSTENLRSKDLQEFLGRQFFGYIVVVCSQAAESCPTVWPGVHEIIRLFFDDPAAATGTDEKRLEKFRAVRDEIKAEVEKFIAEHREQVEISSS